MSNQVTPSVEYTSALNGYVKIVIGKEQVEIIPLERETDGDFPRSRFFQLKLGNRAQARLEFLDVYPPAMALHLPDVFVWSGSRLYRQLLEIESIPQEVDLESEVSAVFSLGKNWCLVCDILIEVRSSDLGTVLQKIEFHEIILENWWEDEVLKLRDLQGRTFGFLPTDETFSLLVQVSGESL